ncbi:lipase [Photobacterium phosphoreum]|uniref:Lipase n=1 Tax=Photobacterium phosphoreum TaxID=659 RepID=A0A2T3JNS8_PHOPO|nr:VolA/Pla-1 family phospholipase [Photobacterium phosphoreum]PSU26489.1 lipase [Photobacterium phosphoreum]PSU41792.1 lipase [Photobacterium phosphoreum]PSU50692.1 lipase [Photobacterium phosphoreum]
MKIRSIALLVTSALSLIGCKGNSTLENKAPIDPNIAASLHAETKVNFDLLSTNKKLILPTYLAMDAQDGTLATETMASDQTNTSDPLVAMGQTDGWSTTQPITINFTGKDLDKLPAENSFYLIKSGDPTNPDDTTKPTLLSQQNKDFTLQVSGHSLIVILLKPLDPASNYMYAVTDNLKDINGQAVGMSNSYALLKSNNLPPAPALLPAQKITHATEEAFHGIIQKRDIIFSSWFTTLSSGDVLFAAKMATEEAINAGAHNVWQGSAIAKTVTPKQLSTLFTFSQPVKVNDPEEVDKKSNVTIYQGTLSLPYYLDIRANKFMNTPWQSGMPSLAKIKYVLSNGSDADKATIVAQLADAKVTLTDMAQVATHPQVQIKVLTRLMGKTLYLANGNQLDPKRLITRYSAVPELKSVQTIDYTLVLPSSKKCQALGANDVTIFQHGITADKSVLTAHSDGLPSLAETLIGNQCRAIFAINQPLHGEDRGIHTIDSDGNSQYKNAAIDPSMYLNLENLTVARDNLRQSTVDVVNLRASIGKLFANIQQQQKNGQTSNNLSPLDMLNPNSGVSFTGHSLGAIVGTNVGNIANRPTMNPTFDKQYFTINKLALANPGAEIPYLLLNSGSFGGLLKAGVLQSTVSNPTEITPDVIQTGKFLQTLNTCYTTQDDKHKDLNKCYVDNIAAIKENNPSLFAKWTATYVKFAYAAQTVMDPVDPINLADGVPPSVPTYVQMVKGDSTIPNITTPNNLPYSPFTGTEPLIKQLNLALNNTNKGWKEYTPGSHTSLLNVTIPTADNSFSIEASKATTINMQKDMADFLNK